ncbi:TetR/AcrR family transcriptional regulator [Angustibacter aerolatus]
MPAGPPRVRRDVARNRELLLGAADTLLAERGLRFTLHDLAAASGLGVATVYRHVTDRDELLAALVRRRFETMRDLLTGAEQHADPVEALRQGVLAVCRFHASDRAAREALLSDAARDRELAEQTLRPVAQRLVQRALESGRVRPDVRESDLPMLFLAAGALASATVPVREDLWQRYVDALLDGLLLHDADRRGGQVPAPSPVELRAVLDGIRRAR